MRWLHIVVFILFSFNILVRIDDYLLWNDEGNTGAMAQRILQHGVPLVDDGKTNLNVTLKKGNSICVKESMNLYLCLGWAEFYVAAPFVYLGNMTTNLYLKTALIRFPFALASILGSLTLYFTFTRYLKAKEKSWVGISFFILLIASVSYTLHSIEARYYSLVILSFSWFLFSYLNLKYKTNKKWLWSFFLVFSSIFFFLSYHPAFYIVLLSTIVFEMILMVLNKKVAKLQIFTLLLGGVLSLPLAIFFEVFKTSKELSQLTSLLFFGSKHFSLRFQLFNLGQVLEYLFKHEYLFVLVITKAIFVYLLIVNKKLTKSLLENKLTQLSLYFTLIYLVYLAVVTRIPALFIRYYLLLIPMGVMMILIDSVCLRRFLSHEAKKAYTYFLISIFVISSVFKVPTWWGSLYELTHDYKGPVDYILEEIDRRYENKKDLVIATNYASYTYVFYFDSKVVVENGYFEDFASHEVDVVIPRKNHVFLPELNKIIAEGEFEKASFNVLDYSYNNISELDEHLFKMPLAQSDEEKLQMFFRKN